MATITDEGFQSPMSSPEPLRRLLLSGPETELNMSDSEEDDVFEDASTEEFPNVDLHEAFIDCERAITKFFNNDVHGAMLLMAPHATTSLYHSLGTAIFAFIPAILTFDQNQIQRAMAAIKTCLTICHRNRKRKGIVETLGSIIKKPNYALYSDQEAHAELCYAEALLLQAALTIIEGEDLTGLIKGTLKVRTCHHAYKHCWDMLKVKEWDSEESRVHFKSGVRLGTATFNLMISMLPPKFLTLLKFAGFSGNRLFQIPDNDTSEVSALEKKYYGLSELQNGSKSAGLRRVLCDLTQLAYHLVLQAFVGGEGDYVVSHAILQKALTEYPGSVWFLVFKARYELLQGNIEEAIKIYQDTSDIGQDGFREFRHLCYWELMWTSALTLDFRASSNYAACLIEQSAWSKTTYTYVKAVMLMQIDSAATRADHTEVKELLRDAPSYKIRIAGKSLPMEKFVIRRCVRYQQQKEKLTLPALELLCIWNLLPILKKKPHVLQYFLKKIEEARLAITSGPRDWMCGLDADNSALLHYLEGSVYLALDFARQALASFHEVLALKKDIKEDHFLVPYAVSDMAMCYYHMQDYKRCIELLTDARKKYSGYSLESRLQFRVHARLQLLRDCVGDP